MKSPYTIIITEDGAYYRPVAFREVEPDEFYINASGSILKRLNSVSLGKRTIVRPLVFVDQTVEGTKEDGR